MISIDPNGLYSAKDLSELFEVVDKNIYPFMKKVKHSKGPGGMRVTGRTLLEYFEQDVEEENEMNPKLEAKIAALKRSMCNSN
ncbi:hypothetical protein QBE53_05950 [Vallitaleaceae bacterium 9-2]